MRRRRRRRRSEQAGGGGSGALPHVLSVFSARFAPSMASSCARSQEGLIDSRSSYCSPYRGGICTTQRQPSMPTTWSELCSAAESKPPSSYQIELFCSGGLLVCLNRELYSAPIAPLNAPTSPLIHPLAYSVFIRSHFSSSALSFTPSHTRDGVVAPPRTSTATGLISAGSPPCRAWAVLQAL